MQTSGIRHYPRRTRATAADATAIAAATVRNLARRTNHRTNRSLTAAFFRERHHTAKSHACY